MSQFSLLTWNISLGTPSVRAPDWDVQTNLYRILDEIERHDPDFLCLQELPDPQVTDLISDRYVSAQSAPSHSGHTSALVRMASIAGQQAELESQFKLQGGSGIMVSLSSVPVMVFSLHLPPYKDNASVRQRYLHDLLRQLPTGPLIIAGDMNMREAETSYVIDDLGLTDVYKELEPGKEHYATWDSFSNPFHEDGFQFRARFDRVFCRGLTPLSYRLIGNEPQTRDDHFLSDHFGILATFEWS